MNNYQKSNYAINKVRKGIVYRNADGSILEVTFEKIAESDPTFTADDFKRLKHLSDELFHEEEKSDNLQAHYIKASLSDVIDKKTAMIGVDEQLIVKEEENSFVRRLQQAIDTQLTPIQKRRLFLNCFRKMSVREIAKVEGTTYTVVAESIRGAKRKLKKILINF